MSLKTSNSFGSITVSNDAIASACGYIARDVYGVVDLVGNRISDSFFQLFKKQPLSKGVKVLTVNNRVYIDLYIVVKYGVSISAVANSIKKEVKFKLEEFTGMIIESVNVNIVGVRV